MKKNILYLILTFLIGFSNISAQETEKANPKNIGSIQASSGGTVEFNGQLSNLAAITQEIDNGGNEFGSLFLNAPIGTPSTSLNHKLWMDNNGKLKFGDDEIGYGWIQNGNMVQLADVTNDYVRIGYSGTLNNNTNVLQVYGLMTTNGFQMDNNGGVGKVLTSDANGVGTWQTLSGGGGGAGEINDLSDGRSLESSITNKSLFLGEQAGNSDNNGNTTGGNNNTGVGIRTLYTNTTGDWNVALGSRALELSQSASKNTAVGYEALRNLGTSSGANDNVAVGYYALLNSTSGLKNTAIGAESMKGYGVSAKENTALGYRSLYANSSTTASGERNTAIGSEALFKNTTGSGNVAIGYNAGYNKLAGESNKLYIHNSNINQPLIYGDFGTFDIIINGDLDVTGTFSNSSDIRLKENIIPLKNALNSLTAIEAVTFNWKMEEFNHKKFDTELMQIGVIAQEVEKVLPELVKTDENGFKSVDYVKLSVVTLGAVKEQQKIIDEQNSKISSQEERLSKLESLLNEKRFTSINK